MKNKKSLHKKKTREIQKSVSLSELAKKRALNASSKYKPVEQPVKNKALPVLSDINTADEKIAPSHKIETVDIVSSKNKQEQIVSPLRLPAYYKIWLIGITSLLAIMMLTELLILILPLRPNWLTLVQPTNATAPQQYFSTNQVDIDAHMQQYFANKKPRKSMTVNVSAYSSTKSQTDKTPYVTAYNTHVRDGIVAANFLPVGTVVRFPQRFGDKLFVVEDRMDERFGLQVDIWMSRLEEAKKFGIQFLEMEVY